jgi:ATP/maltotriose-dependent transcriptional regulator MalT
VEAVGNREYIAQAQATLAQIHAVQGDLAGAESLYQKALNLFEQVGSRTGFLRVQLSYAQFLEKQGQTHQATKLEQASRAEAAQIGLYLMPF